MLIMKCRHCRRYIHSELLAELRTIQCEHCGLDVEVEHVLVSSNGFTFSRDDLLKRFFRYRKLLDEVIDERNSMLENPHASRESLHSMEQFIEILQGMMSGARDHFRYELDPYVMVRLIYAGQNCYGYLYNVSMTGACLEIAPDNPLPRVGHAISVEFQLPDRDDKFLLEAETCWTKRGNRDLRFRHRVGIGFSLEEGALKTALWDFISEHATEPQR